MRCACRHLPWDYMAAKAESRTQPHQPGAPMQHLPATSAHPLQPFRQLILRAHMPGVNSAVDNRLASHPSDASSASAGHELGDLDRMGSEAASERSISKAGSDKVTRRPSLGDWFRGQPCSLMVDLHLELTLLFSDCLDSVKILVLSRCMTELGPHFLCCCILHGHQICVSKQRQLFKAAFLMRCKLLSRSAVADACSIHSICSQMLRSHLACSQQDAQKYSWLLDYAALRYAF